jgi:hypothetical protein
MKRLRPRTAVITGATLGLIAGAAAFGAVASSSVTASPSTPLKAALVSVATPRTVLAPCAKGQKLEHGDCIVHVIHTVVVPAAGGSGWNGAEPGNGSSGSGSQTTQPGGHAGYDEAAGHAQDNEAAEPGSEASREAAERAAEASKEAAEHAAEAAKAAAEHAAESHG